MGLLRHHNFVSTLHYLQSRLFVYLLTINPYHPHLPHIIQLFIRFRDRTHLDVGRKVTKETLGRN